MVDNDDIAELLHAQPFRRFDIKTSDGRVYTVDHPDFIARDRLGRNVTYYTDDNRRVKINLTEIVALEDANK